MSQNLYIKKKLFQNLYIKKTCQESVYNSIIFYHYYYHQNLCLLNIYLLFIYLLIQELLKALRLKRIPYKNNIWLLFFASFKLLQYILIFFRIINEILHNFFPFIILCWYLIALICHHSSLDCGIILYILLNIFYFR